MYTFDKIPVLSSFDTTASDPSTSCQNLHKSNNIFIFLSQIFFLEKIGGMHVDQPYVHRDITVGDVKLRSKL